MRTKGEYDAYIANRNKREQILKSQILFKVMSLNNEGIHECFFNVREDFEYSIRNYLETLCNVRVNSIKRSEIGNDKKVLLHLKWNDIGTLLSTKIMEDWRNIING